MKLQDAFRNLTRKSLFGRLLFIDFDAAMVTKFFQKMSNLFFKMKKRYFFHATLFFFLVKLVFL